MGTIRNIFISMRPHHWTKNLLVFGGLVFSKSFTDSKSIVTSILAFIVFCLVSSSIYLFNDYMDRNADKLNPMKADRPIAAGKLKSSLIFVLIVVLFLICLTMSLYIDHGFFAIIAVYIVLNIGYSMGLKKIVILDAFIVSFGFLLRTLSGAVAINVEASSWIMICTLFLAFIITFGKRRYELANLKIQAKAHRASLGEYSLRLLDGLMIISSSAAIVTYSMYTFDPSTIQHFSSPYLIYSTIFVAFGIFRYLFLVFNLNKGAAPIKLLFLDKPLIINGILWIVFIVVILMIG